MKKIISTLVAFVLTFAVLAPFTASATDYGTIALKGGETGKFPVAGRRCCEDPSSSLCRPSSFRVQIYTCCRNYTLYSLSVEEEGKPGGKSAGRYGNCVGDFVGAMDVDPDSVNYSFEVYIENKEPEGTCQTFTARTEYPVVIGFCSSSHSTRADFISLCNNTSSDSN